MFRVTIGDHRHWVSEDKTKQKSIMIQWRPTYLASLRARSWHHNWIRWLGRNVCAICLLVCGPRAGIRMLPGKLQLWTRGGITSASLGCWYIMNRTGPFSASEKTSRLDDSGGWIKKKNKTRRGKKVKGSWTNTSCSFEKPRLGSSPSLQDREQGSSLSRELYQHVPWWSQLDCRYL